MRRWWGGEILDHSREAVDSTYLDQGMAVLVEHTTGRHIGRVENWSLGSDRILRGEAVFDDEDPEAIRIHSKVRRKFLRFTSVGYRINELKLDRSGDDGDTYRATRWTPYEVSFVAVPADPTVGANRAASEGLAPVPVRHTAGAPDSEPDDGAADNPQAPAGQEREMPERNAPAGAETDVRVTSNDPNADTRVHEITAIAEQHGMLEKLPGWLRGGASVETVKGEIIQELKARLESGPKFRNSDLSEKEEKEYSFARAIAAAADGRRTFEIEYSEHLQEKLGRSIRQGEGGNGISIYIPTNIGARAGLDSGTATKGTELKFVQAGSFIDMLRNRARVLQAGATMLAGLDGPVTFPKQNGAGTFHWVGENPGTDVAESNLLLTTVSLTAKTGQSTTSFSRQLLRQAVIDVENLVRNDLAAIHALAIDAAAFTGTGTGQPLGIFNSTSVGIVTIGANGGAPTYDHMVDMETKVEEANADVGGMAYIATPGIKGKLKKTQKFATTNGEPVWTGGQEGQMNGYTAYATNQMPGTLTKGTVTGTLHGIAFGVWSQMLIGEWGVAELIVDPYALKKQGMIEVTSFQMIDIALRHPEAFCVIKDAAK